MKASRKPMETTHDQTDGGRYLDSSPILIPTLSAAQEHIEGLEETIIQLGGTESGSHFLGSWANT